MKTITVTIKLSEQQCKDLEDHAAKQDLEIESYIATVISDGISDPVESDGEDCRCDVTLT